MRIALGQKMETFILISIGAILGANARYWLGVWAAERWGSSFPVGTMIINLSGSFLLGFFLILATERLMLAPAWRLIISVGFLGAYTTFSTYTFDSLNLILKGQWVPGLLNLFGSSILGAVCAGAGMILGKSV